mmetsp:Transcript_12459/g.23387  ORF Transcript_12459/g.23387 Transcript_12459/m.23387 type:complete len:509 (+) Transcript_12459:453-1979(+)
MYKDDERLYIETVYTRNIGSNIARTTGTISVVSSALLVLVILRSNIGLSSVYHRIMLCMSLADIIASIAIALTTIPMPKDMIYTQFEPKAYGTTATCSIQGFFFTFGSVVTFGYNTSLCLYYLFAIRYKMKDSKFRKRVEPWLHILCFVLPLHYAVIYLFAKTYNPSPIEGWCTTAAYPWICGLRSERRQGCEARNVNIFLRRYGTIFALFGFVLGFTVLIGSMTLIFWSVYRQERLLKVYIANVYGRKQQRQQDQPVEEEDGISGQERKNLSSSRSRHHLTKVILYQALAYVLAFLICQSNVFVSLAQNAERTEVFRSSTGSQIYHLITRPLQGFFNLVVFLGHKVYNLRQFRQDMRICQAIWHVMTVREEPRFVFSRISLVANSGRDGDEIGFDGGDDNEEDDEMMEVESKQVSVGSGNSVNDMVVNSSNSKGSADGKMDDSNMSDGTLEKFQDDYSHEKDGFSSFGPASWFSGSSSAKSRYHDNGSNISAAGGISWQTNSTNSKP